MKCAIFTQTLTPDDTAMSPFVSSIEDMYWLDGGHNGGKNTWITSRSLIETLCRQNIRVHVSVVVVLMYTYCRASCITVLNTHAHMYILYPCVFT